MKISWLVNQVKKIKHFVSFNFLPFLFRARDLLTDFYELLNHAPLAN